MSRNSLQALVLLNEITKNIALAITASETKSVDIARQKSALVKKAPLKRSADR